MFHSITDFPFIERKFMLCFALFSITLYFGLFRYCASILLSAICTIARKKVAGAKQEVLSRQAKIVGANCFVQFCGSEI